MEIVHAVKGRGGEELSLELTRGLERSFLGGPNGSGKYSSHIQISMALD